jgi:tetratricopeptide (TPR) repeat protein
MSDDEERLLFRLDERVDAIGERVATLEGKFEKEKVKGLKQRLSEYGGILALVLSIVIGAFTVYDKIIIQPQKARATESDDFRKDLDTLVQLSAQISSLDWRSNPIAAQAQAQSLTPQKIALIEKIERFGEMRPDELKYADRLMLANENELFMWYEKALMHAKKALELAVDSFQTANAYWAIARLNGKLNKPTEMRTYYEKAIREFQAVGLKTTAGAVMQLYTQWVYLELLDDESCASARKVFEAMKAVYSKPEVWPATKVASQSAFQAMVSQAPRNCGLELH